MVTRFKLNAIKAESPVEAEKEKAPRRNCNGGRPARPAAGDSLSAGVSARGVGVRALLSAHEEVSTRVAANSALVARLLHLTADVTP